MKVMIRDLVRVFKGQLILGDPKTVVTRASIDSRTVEPGVLFFALKGARADGHAYAMAACRQGVAAVVVSHLDWMGPVQNLSSAVIRVENPQEALQQLGTYLRGQFKGAVVGITGSNGKTTTKQMTASVLQALGKGLSTKGNYNSQLGLPLVLSELAEDHSWIVLELGASEPGHILKLAEIAHPKIGVITSIGPAHLASFGSVAMIAQSKWELMESLPSDGMAVVPWGEPTLEPLIRSFTKRLVFFGEDSSCAVRASAIESKDDTRFILHIGSMSAKVQLPVPGRFNVKNALASAAVGWLLGISVDRIAEGLRSFVPPPMRMQTIKHSSGAIFVNDAYNANPASMVQSIWSFMENYSDKERVVVLGSMAELGEESPKLHFHIGTEVGKCTINKIFLFGEETKMVLDGLMAVGRNQRDIVHTNKIEELIEQVRKQLKPNVAILFKGSRVMQLERVIEALQKNAEVNV